MLSADNGGTMTFRITNRRSRRNVRLGGFTAALLLLQLVPGTAAYAAHHRAPRTAARTCQRQRSGCASAASAAVCPNADLQPTTSNTSLVAAATLCLINQQRTTRHERPLRNNADLDQVAGQYSQSMVAGDYFSHVSPTGATLLDRVRESGYLRTGDAYELGENIAIGTAWLATPAATVTAWMNSPDHRENILDPDFTSTGIGVVAAVPAQYSADEAGATYTQDFGVVQAQ